VRGNVLQLLQLLLLLLVVIAISKSIANEGEVF
jgi:hypothetical protein